MHKQVVNVFCALSCVISGGLSPVFLPSVQAAELQTYERKYLSFYPADHPQFNQALSQGIQKELPRFDYQNLELPPGSDLNAFMQTVYRYQQENAGALAARKEVPDMRFGSKVVSWQETLKVMNAAFVMVPKWSFGAMKLENLHQPKDASSWYVDLTADLHLNLEIYRLNDGQIELYDALQEDWEISKELPVNNMSTILDSIKEGTGGLADPENPLVSPLIIEALKTIAPFKEILASSADQQLGREALAKLESDVYANLIKDLKSKSAFILKNQIEDVLPDRDRVQVLLGAGETAETLGTELDQGFKVVEYQLENGQEQTLELGYIKLREHDKENLYLQPIIARRDFELGDQLIEYPLLGTNLDLFAGTASLGLDGDEQNQFAPQAGLRFEFSLAKALKVSELYGLLSAGVGMPLSTEQNLSQFSGSNPGLDAFALPMSIELGLLKRWYLRQWILEAGVQGGALVGLLLNSEIENMPTTLSPGLSAFVGTGWQVSPDFLIGLQGGWRFFLPTGWSSKGDSGNIDVAYPGISANGPLVSLYGSWMF